MALERYFGRRGDVHVRKVIERLESLLQVSNCGEGEFQQLISQNAFLLLPLAPRRSLFVVAQPRLGDEYVADFAMYGEMNINWWTLVEIERPSLRLFTKAGDPTAPSTHALQQTYDWERWWRSSSSGQTAFGDGTSPESRSVLLIGRRHTLTKRDQARLQAYGFVYTYDSLLEIARPMLQLKPEALVQRFAIPWDEFRRIRQECSLFNLAMEHEAITGNPVYARPVDFTSSITDVAFQFMVGNHGISTADEVISVCRAFVDGSHIPTPSNVPAVRLLAFLYELRTIPWGEATEVPVSEVAVWQRVRKTWRGLADFKCADLLVKALDAKFADRTDDIRAAVREAVRAVRIFSHPAIITTDHYALSLLVPGWCEVERDIWAAEMGLLRAGCIVTSNLLINRSNRTLAVLW
jgi:hypothetical protein